MTRKHAKPDLRMIPLDAIEVLNPRDRNAQKFEDTHAGQIPGVVDARATICAQELSSDSTLFVVSEPATSLCNPPNHVLAWVIQEAESRVLSAIRRHKLGPESEWIHDRAALLDKAARVRTLREVMLSSTVRRRPGTAAIREARKSFSPLYRLAAEAALLFEGVERMDADAIRFLLSGTLVAQLEDWQKLELATALSAAEALAMKTGAPVRWKGSISGGTEIAVIGRYSVRWQNALPKRPTESLDPSEIMVRSATEALGASIGLTRADVTIRDNELDLDVAHFECKWFGSPLSAASAIVDAVSQLVRYCRDSRPTSIEEAQAMLIDCVIVCADLSGFTDTLDGSTPVGLTDFSGLLQGKLGKWAERVCCAGSAQSS
ncbi:ParB N-terminal domain-containing protein [Ralstonia mannitolilytica]|uniref:hypothetical protein n=1 Tax=Ralstonia mannitolilytica TaxID=105219 RepID=UPI0028F5CB95|nr:hypothetical protein [Ralstonia mannitolilytica]CAJ0741902.1 hypothetical protein R76696_03701 [Ralstonia mannitolilytica]